MRGKDTKVFKFEEHDIIPALPEIVSPSLRNDVFAHTSRRTGQRKSSFKLLEQRGDVVYNAAVVCYILDEFPDIALTELQLIQFAKGLGIADRIQKPVTENSKVPADVQEAYIGAIQIEKGVDAAFAFARQLVKPAISFYREQFREVVALNAEKKTAGKRKRDQSEEIGQDLSLGSASMELDEGGDEDEEQTEEDKAENELTDESNEVTELIIVDSLEDISGPESPKIQLSDREIIEDEREEICEEKEVSRKGKPRFGESSVHPYSNDCPS
ncbi:hypothetical protein ABW20_dc0105216 [Dactylellina cionopaga]|nr:hypothetical protein ABW20_dc0105216 [Dactylellina cionopaga]